MGGTGGNLHFCFRQLVQKATIEKLDPNSKDWGSYSDGPQQWGSGTFGYGNTEGNSVSCSFSSDLSSIRKIYSTGWSDDKC